MDILRKDFGVIWDQVSDHYLKGKPGTIFNDNGQVISKDSFSIKSSIAGGPVEDNLYKFNADALFHVLQAAIRLLYTGIFGSEKISLDRLLKHWGDMDDISKRFKKADWYYDYSDDSRVWAKGNQEIKQLLNDLKSYDTPEEKALLHGLWKVHVPENSVAMPDFISLKNCVMNSEEFEFNQRQFKHVGMLDHFNSGLIDKMNQGDQRIQHDIKPTIDGETVSGAVHLNKAKEGNKYFLNKFELERTRPNGTTVKQTFYNNNRPKAGEEEKGQKVQQQQWTQKRAYNFLSGRPVYDKQNDTWNKINFNEKLKNGNYATDRFDKNYGFDLRKTMGGYSFADAGDNVKMDQLAEGLQRGNLQKAKMVSNDGKKEDYHVALSIRTSSMKVYDNNKKEVPLEQQVEKGLITKELAEQLKMIYGKKQDQNSENKIEGNIKPEGLSQKAENKQTQGRSPKEVVKQSNGQNEKEAQGTGKQKHSHKH